MLFGAAYYPEHRDPARWEFDLDNMAGAGINAIRVGEFAWKRLEPKPGEYDFGWLDEVLTKAAKRGIKLVLCPPLRTAPAWLVERDPTVLIEDYLGRRLEFGSRYTFCINHPLLRERGFSLAAEMARRYGGSGFVAGWHLDNEFGCDKDCHCQICRGKWHGALAERYKTIEELNKRWGNVFWGLEYDAFGQVPTPRLSHTNLNPAQLQAWRQFRSDCTAELVRLHAECVRPHLAGQFISTNCQSPYTNPTDYYSMAEPLDVCGTNYYPPYGENCLDMSFRLAALRAYKPGRRSFHVFELRAAAHPVPGMEQNVPEPGAMERLGVHVVANGAEGIFYFRWRICPFGAEQTWSGLTGYDGQPVRVYREVGKLKVKLDRIAPLLKDTEVKSRAAVLWDYPARWSFDAGWILTKPPNLHVAYAERLYQAIRGLGYNCDAAGRRSDLSSYRLIAVPCLPLVDDELVAKLREFVKGGGVLVAHPFTGTKNMDCEVFPERMHPGLAELFGINVREYATGPAEEKGLVEWHGRRYTAGYFFDLPQLAGAAAHGRYAVGWFRGTPAITERAFGRGRAVYVAAFASENFYRDFLPVVLRRAGVVPILPGKHSRAVEITERVGPDGRRLIFLMNATGRRQRVRLPRAASDAWAGKKTGRSINLPPRGASVVVFPA